MELASTYLVWLARFISLNQLVYYHRIASVSFTQKIFLKDMRPEAIGVVVAFDLEPLEEDELLLQKGDIIRVTDG